MADGTAVAILRVLFNWAVEDAKHLRANPCLGVKALKYQGGTNHVWSDAEMLRFEAAYPWAPASGSPMRSCSTAVSAAATSSAWAASTSRTAG